MILMTQKSKCLPCFTRRHHYGLPAQEPVVLGLESGAHLLGKMEAGTLDSPAAETKLDSRLDAKLLKKGLHKNI